jgi:Zn-dependent protease
MSDFTPELLMLGFLWYVAFLFSTTCHEAAHALVAKIGGDETAALGGQVTLNPIPHIRREPFGMVVIPILSFIFSRSMIGWASAPYDPGWQRRYPRRAAWMALAGPAANFTLMTIAGITLRLGLVHDWFPSEANSAGGAGLLFATLQIFFTLNLFLGTFNLLPVPPLDGSTAITLLMPEGTALRYLDWLRESSFRMMGLVIAVLLFGRIFGYIYAFARYVFFYGL